VLRTLNPWRIFEGNPMNASEYYKGGKLKEALTASLDEVKKNPLDANRRGFLCELLCFAGDLERADTQMDVLTTQDPSMAMVISLFRQLVRAEKARQEFYNQGRLPEFLDQPSEVLRLHLEASIHLREGRTADGQRLLQQAEEKRPRPSGTCDGKPFTDLRDLDDLTAPFFEVLTSTGKYYWIPIEQVELVELRAPARPRDLLWQRAHMIVRGGPDGEVYLPTLYANTFKEADDELRLGRLTDWRGGNNDPVRGLGLRTLLVGDDARPLLEIKEIVFQEQ
jgi:type VI secretion system protein ImpE